MSDINSHLVCDDGVLAMSICDLLHYCAYLLGGFMVEGLPFVVTQKSKAVKFQQAVARLMSEIDQGERSVEEEGWVSEKDILAE